MNYPRDRVVSPSNLADISDLALGAEGRTAFRSGLITILERLIPHDTIIIYSARSADDVLVECAARGWRALLAGEGAKFHREASARLSPSEMNRIYTGHVDAKRTLEASMLRGESMYIEYIEPYRIGACFIRNWVNRRGFFGLALGRCNPGRDFVGRARDVMEQVLPVVQAAEGLLSPAPCFGPNDRIGEWASLRGLSKREVEVLRYLMRGLSNREIAELLGIASLTVRNQVASIFKKAAVSNRTELVWASLCDSPNGQSRGTDGDSQFKRTGHNHSRGH